MKTRVVDRIPEWRFQSAVVARLHKLEADGHALTCAGDMAAARRNASERSLAKVTGLTPGEPDIRVYLTGGVLIGLELKTPDGRRSKDQKERHALLGGLGFEILTISAPTPDAMADEVERIVLARLTKSTA